MQFIKIDNGTPIGNPISENELRKRFSHISFPKKISQDNITQLDYFILYESEKPTHSIFEKVVQGKYQLIDEKWYTSWIIQPMEENEIIAVTESRKNDVRRRRDAMLQQTDWIVTKSNELGDEIPLDWKIYRQSLRDISLQEGFPFEVIWPTKPL